MPLAKYPWHTALRFAQIQTKNMGTTTQTIKNMSTLLSYPNQIISFSLLSHLRGLPKLALIQC